MIKAWDQGVLTMQLGEIARITATPDFGYGAGGFPAWGIMPKCVSAARAPRSRLSLSLRRRSSTLVFEIEVLKME